MGHDGTFDYQAQRQIPFRAGFHNLDPGVEFNVLNDQAQGWTLIVLGWSATQLNVPVVLSAWMGVQGTSGQKVVYHGDRVDDAGAAGSIIQTDLAIPVLIGETLFIKNSLTSALTIDVGVWGIFIPSVVLLNVP